MLFIIHDLRLLIFESLLFVSAELTVVDDIIVIVFGIVVVVGVPDPLPYEPHDLIFNNLFFLLSLLYFCF